MKTKTQNRIEWIDMAKGIAILAVVVGHSIEGASLLNNVIFSFHGSSGISVG